MSENNCIFCKIINRQIPSEIIEETQDLIVIKDIAPKAKIHYLIIPKKHVQDIQSFDQDDLILGQKIFQMARLISEKEPKARHFKLVINNGTEAGQVVLHLHIHFIAGNNLKEF